MRDSRLSRSFRIDLDEISALALRNDGDGRARVLAVGDRDFVVVTATLAQDALHDEHPENVGTLIDEQVADAGSSSEWEAIAADGAGRVFLVREDAASVVVLDPGLDRHVHTVELACKAGPDERAAELLDDGNAGPEAILLLRNGHLLVAKQRDPVLLIEFGPERHDAALGFGAGAQLAVEEEFELSGGARSRLFPLRSWQLREEDEEEVESLNDLAVDDEGRVLAISSLSRCLYELRSGVSKDEFEATPRWRLPKSIEPGDDRKPEGLTFDREGRPLVAIDTEADDQNVFLLERLER